MLFLNHLPKSCQARVARDTSDTDNHLTIDDFSPADDGNGSSVPFIDVANLKDLDLAELLEINFINNSVHHYRGKFQQVHSSLQGRIRELIANVRGSSQASQFSPELKAKLTDSFLKLVEQLNLSPLCLTSLNHLRMEIMEKRLWPLKFIDAMEFIPSGAFEGVLSSFGLFEECITIESPSVKWNSVRGKYCLAKVRLPFMNPTFPDAYDLELEARPPNSSFTVDLARLSAYGRKKALFEHLDVNFDELNNKLKLLQMINMLNGSHYRIGLCFPSTCSSAELQGAFNKFLEPFEVPLSLEIEDECTVADQEIELDNYQRVAIIVLGGLALLVGASTCYEYYLSNYRRDPAKSIYDGYLITFSALSNTRALFTDEGDRRLCVVETIILVFVALEFIGRSYVLPVFYGMINIKRPLDGLPKEYFTARKFFFIRGSSFAACTYVLGCSIILAYNICAHKSTIKPTLINYLKFAANRYLSYIRRLVGPIFLVYLMPLLGDGPIWHYYKQIYTGPCKDNILPSLLFYSNFASSLDDVCVPPSVILSTLFYLSLAAPIILYSLNNKMLGAIVFLGLILLGSIASVLPKYVFNLPVAPYEIAAMSSVAQAKLSFVHYYAATDQLLVVFVCGLFIGYLIKCKPKINLGGTFTNLVLWVGLMALPFISTNWNEGFKPLEGNFSQFSFVSWFVLSKIMWAAGFGWMMFACSTDRAGPFSDLFRVPLLRPLTKLAFTVYINHITILSFRQLSKKELGPLTHVEILTDDLADIVIAFIVSYIFYILIERPMYYWIKIVLQLQPQQLPPNGGRFSTNDLESNGKRNRKEEEGEFALKPLNSSETRH